MIAGRGLDSVRHAETEIETYHNVCGSVNELRQLDLLRCIDERPKEKQYLTY